MTSEALAWAWRQHLNAPSKLVLLALADLADGQHHRVQLEVKTISTRTGLAVRTVRTHLRALERSNHLVEEERRDTGGRRLGNVHHLNVDGLAPVPLPGVPTIWRTAS